jgi:hypothetical protein
MRRAFGPENEGAERVIQHVGVGMNREQVERRFRIRYRSAAVSVAATMTADRATWTVTVVSRDDSARQFTVPRHERGAHT